PDTLEDLCPASSPQCAATNKCAPTASDCATEKSPAPPVLLGAVGLGFFLWHNPLRSERIYSWLHIEETKLGKGLQAYQAMVALGSGGVAGVGLGDGRQKLGFIPEHHTDFIFSVIGEELGLIATLGVVLGFGLVVF